MAAEPIELAPVGGADDPRSIVVRGAREHNLRDVDVDIPRDRLVVVTGPSGSGKSSLAFDTLYAEGQRRYVESLSAYARQFLDQLSRPEVDSIEGLSPALSIEQRTVGRNPRSTVGTATEIADHLRLLYARAGEPECPRCGRPIGGQSPQEMADRVLTLPERTLVEIFAPAVRGRRGAYKKELDGFRRRGYVRVRVDGVLHELDDPPELARNRTHDIEVSVDRLRVKESVRARLTESIETALSLADGLLEVAVGGEGDAPAESWRFSRDATCADCGIGFPELAPRMFSFNSPAGACPGCGGLGVRRELSPERIVPDPSRSLAEGPIAPWNGGRMARWYARVLASLAEHLDLDPDTPWSQLPERARNGILFGLGREQVAFELPRLTRSGRPGRSVETVRMTWDGVIDELERRDAERDGSRSPLDRYRVERPCPDCEGTRLRPEARSVRFGGRALDELCRASCAELQEFFEKPALSERQGRVAERVLSEVRERLGFLCDVGLGYLSLDRPTASLSGGEAQRIRLATQIGSRLLGVLYILDEPSIGLHPRDNRRLLDSLVRLRDMGNSLLVVEHDEETIRSADWVIDMGPGAGAHGGAIVACGTPDELARTPDSLTGDYLSGRRRIEAPAERRRPQERFLELVGCREHNLKEVHLQVPLGLLTVVTGVSGSGKSTLVDETLYRALAGRLHGALDPPGAFDALRGIEQVDRVIAVDQAPIGRSPRSNPVTYTGAFSGIRNLFAGVPESRVRGYGPGRFSFNVKGGRCEACQGDGSLRVEMSLLPDLFVTCEQCQGRRYNRETLQIRYKGRSIADVLEMSVEEGAAFLDNVASVRRPLQALLDVGLGYVKLGQPATTLSGGEAQRIKLARELGKRSSGRTLYLLDEPTTGLHFADVAKLLELLDRLVDQGNTVIVIEHHLDVIRHADWVIDLGPEGGQDGGRIVAEGPPEEIARAPESHTGRALAAR